MTTLGRLTYWEWFKLRRRWMPWILLALLLLFSQLAIWASFFNYRQLLNGGDVFLNAPAGGARPQSISCSALLGGTSPPAIAPAILAGLRAQCAQAQQQRTQQLPRVYANFTLPGSIRQALRTASNIGVILTVVLAASTVGVEYGWGTMRTTLVRGTGRWQYLVSKLLLLILVTLAGLLVVSLASVVSSLVARSLAAPPPGFAAAGWDTAAGAVGRAWYSLMPMLALAVLIAVLASSSAMAMAIAIGYYVAEPIVLALLGQISSHVAAVSDYLLASNISGWIGGGIGQRFGATQGDTLGSPHHFVVMLVYGVIFVALAVWLIQVRDVTKATGT